MSDTAPGPLVHIAGLPVEVGCQYRQRCAWCGLVLSDRDLSREMIPAGQDPTPGHWEAGALVRVEGGLSYVVAGPADPDLPEDACARLPHEITA